MQNAKPPFRHSLKRFFREFAANRCLQPRVEYVPSQFPIWYSPFGCEAIVGGIC